MTPEEKAAAKAKLKLDVDKLREDTLSYWTMLFRSDEEFRKHCGYSKGADDMIKKLNADYEKKFNKLMEAFDRGDFD